MTFRTILTCWLLVFCRIEAWAQPQKVSRLSAAKPTNVLLIQGLNQAPSGLIALQNALIKEGISNSLVELAGHRTSAECGLRYSNLRQRWTASVADRLSFLGESKVVLIGYSMGALLALDAAQQHPTKVAGLVLLAPPVAFTTKAQLLRVLTPFSVFSWSLPSFAPTHARLCDRTSLAAYRAVFALQNQVLQTQSTIGSIPTLVVATAEDEIVSYSGVQRWYEKQRGSSWRFIEVNTLSDSLPAHLITDPQAHDPEKWSILLNQIQSFIRQALAQR